MGLIQSSLWTLRKVDRWRAGNPPIRSDEEFHQDPYPTYDRIRARGKIVRSYANQGWLVNGFEEVQQVLREPRLSSDIRRNKFFYSLLRVASNGLDIPLIDKPAMLTRDPPDHTRLRKLVATGFVQNYIQSLAPMIETLVDELLDKVTGDAQIDVIEPLLPPGMSNLQILCGHCNSSKGNKTYAEWKALQALYEYYAYAELDARNAG